MPAALSTNLCPSVCLDLLCNYSFLVPAGTVTKQTTTCQEIASIHNKFHAPKLRQNSKKRKRGDSVAHNDKTVWMTKDVECIPETVQILPLQGNTLKTMMAWVLMVQN